MRLRVGRDTGSLMDEDTHRRRDLKRANQLISMVHESLDQMKAMMQAREGFDGASYLVTNAKWHADSDELNSIMGRLFTTLSGAVPPPPQ